MTSYQRKVVIEISLNGRNCTYQEIIREMFSKFICFLDLKSGQAKRIRKRAKNIAASMQRVESIALSGDDRNILTVIGEELDTVRLVQLLRDKVCQAKIVSLGPNKKDEPAAEPNPLLALPPPAYFNQPY